jgi:hypothetical protein
MFGSSSPAHLEEENAYNLQGLILIFGNTTEQTSNEEHHPL